jgi:hypothetical protein
VNWPEIILEGFPGPRDDEPPDLRGDIADELNDHLVCAMQRELRRTDDPAAAEHAVLDRFGDPKRIARRLWWDAMKEQIVRNRIMTAVTVLSLLACLAVSVFAWMTVQQSHETNKAILAKLETLSRPAAQPEVPGDWSMVTFRCVAGDRQGQPAAGVELWMQVTQFGQIKYLSERTDNEGKVTFGPVPAGDYRWGARLSGFTSSQSFTLYPTRHQQEVVVCPSSDAFADIAFAVDWPVDLKDRGFLALCDFDPPSGGSQWRPRALSLDGREWQPALGEVIVTADGRILEGWTKRSLGSAYGSDNTVFGPNEELTVGGTSTLFLATSAHAITEQKTLRRPAASYPLAQLVVLVSANRPDEPEAKWKDWIHHWHLTNPVRPKNKCPVFVAEPGRLNTWTITLPDPVLKAVREYLAAQSKPATASKPAA